MKRVFRFPKGQYWDGDERMFEFLEDYLIVRNENSHFYTIRKNWKVTIIVEEEKAVRG